MLTEAAAWREIARRGGTEPIITTAWALMGEGALAVEMETAIAMSNRHFLFTHDHLIANPDDDIDPSPDARILAALWLAMDAEAGV